MIEWHSTNFVIFIYKFLMNFITDVHLWLEHFWEISNYFLKNCRKNWNLFKLIESHSRKFVMFLRIFRRPKIGTWNAGNYREHWRLVYLFFFLEQAKMNILFQLRVLWKVPNNWGGGHSFRNIFWVLRGGSGTLHFGTAESGRIWGGLSAPKIYFSCARM